MQFPALPTTQRATRKAEVVVKATAGSYGTRQTFWIQSGLEGVTFDKAGNVECVSFAMTGPDGELMRIRLPLEYVKELVSVGERMR
jgi:hypothetical protein